VNPFSTGGGGYHFEFLVAVSYLVSLLRRQTGRGLEDAVVHQVRLQQRNRGHWFDDIVVEARDRYGSRLLSLQVRHRVFFTKNPAFQELIASAWREFRRRGFRRGRDGVGIAVAGVGLSSAAKSDTNDLTGWAVTSADAKAYYQKVGRFAGKRKLLAVIEGAIRTAVKHCPKRADVFAFMRHLSILTYDFGSKASQDETTCLNELRDFVAAGDPGQARQLLAIIYTMATEYATTGGEITHQAIVTRIRRDASFAIPSLNLGSPNILELLRRQVTNKLAAEKNSRKYIPNVFIETTGVKDEARLFCHPALFLQRLEEEIRRFHLRGINRNLSQVGLPEVCLGLPASMVTSGQLQSLQRDANILAGALDRLEADLSRLESRQIQTLRPLVPTKGREAFDLTSYATSSAADSSVSYKIPGLRRLLDTAQARVFAIVSRAGQGKTNFVCDLAEHVLLPRGIPCLLLTGRDFRNIGAGQMLTHVARAASAGSTGDLHNVLKSIEEEAAHLSVPAVLILDAINENDSIASYALELEQFITECLVYPHVRVIVTCRSEYFDERFGNLQKSCFADHMIVKKEILREMEDRHRERLIPAYFEFFKIRCAGMAEDVRRRLSEDVFLLRTFCEAYGNPDAKECRTLPAVRTLRKDAMFKAYMERKLEAVSERAGTRGTLGRQHPYKHLLYKTLKWMLDNGQCANVPTTAFTAAELESLTRLLDEDLFLRKDPAGPGSILGLQAEVVSFTFDEFRDYLLAGYLLDEFLPQGREQFERQVARLTDPERTVSEGVAQYLFLLSRHPAQHAALTIIRTLPWYDRAFGWYVFDLDDNEICQEDVDKIRGACIGGEPSTPSMLVSLLVRWDSALYTKLSIQTMFEVMDKMTPEQFHSATASAFGSGRYSSDRAYYPIAKLTDRVQPWLLSTGRDWYDGYTHLARLLLYLWDITDSEYGHPAQRLFETFAHLHLETARALVDDHLAHKRKGYAGVGLGWLQRVNEND